MTPGRVRESSAVTGVVHVAIDAAPLAHSTATITVARVCVSRGGPERVRCVAAGTDTLRHDAESGLKTPRRPSRREREGRMMRLQNFPCWALGHMYRVKAGDKDMLVCQRCGARELVWRKRLNDRATSPWT